MKAFSVNLFFQSRRSFQLNAVFHCVLTTALSTRFTRIAVAVSGKLIAGESQTLKGCTFEPGLVRDPNSLRCTWEVKIPPKTSSVSPG